MKNRGSETFSYLGNKTESYCVGYGKIEEVIVFISEIDVNHTTWRIDKVIIVVSWKWD